MEVIKSRVLTVRKIHDTTWRLYTDGRVGAHPRIHTERNKDGLQIKYAPKQKQDDSVGEPNREWVRRDDRYALAGYEIRYIDTYVEIETHKSRSYVRIYPVAEILVNCRRYYCTKVKHSDKWILTPNIDNAEHATHGVVMPGIIEWSIGFNWISERIVVKTVIDAIRFTECPTTCPTTGKTGKTMSIGYATIVFDSSDQDEKDFEMEF